MPLRIHQVCGLAIWVLLGSLGALRAEETKIRVLILSGQNNHDWRTTTPKLKALLDHHGRFAVDVTEHPEQCDAATLSKYDLLLSNWNTFGTAPVTNWPVATRTAFMDFVRNGKGFVSVHAGSSSFYDWPEYQQLVGGWWQLGQTSHGPPHDFTVTISDTNHPVTVGLTNFVITDELWHRPGLHPAVHVLATARSAEANGGAGADEPVALTTRFGQGRCFNLLLGHDVKAMAAPGFAALLTRGVEWAATGKVVITPH